MKYTIETTDNGCVETLEFSNGSKFTKRTERTGGGCKALDADFAEQLEEAGFEEEILDKVYDLFDGFLALDFLKLAELDK